MNRPIEISKKNRYFALTYIFYADDAGQYFADLIALPIQIRPVIIDSGDTGTHYKQCRIVINAKYLFCGNYIVIFQQIFCFQSF